MQTPDTPPPLPPPPSPAPRASRGFWAAFGLGIAGLLAMVVAQLIAAILFGGFRGFQYYMQHHRAMPSEMAARLATDPLLLSLCIFASVPAVWGALVLMVRIQRGGRLRNFLALRGFDWKQFLIWLAALAAVLFAGGQLLRWIGEGSDASFTLGLLLDGANLPLIVIAIVVAAPLVEEPLFRGFMYRGMARSRWTTLAAIVIPNCLWVMLHVQYKWPTLLVLFAMGLVFAFSRYFSGSTLLPICLHALANGFAVAASLAILHPTSLGHGIDLTRSSVLGYTLKADAAKKSGNYSLALVDYSEALKLDPQNRKALGQRGILYRWQRKYDASIDDFNRILKLSPSDTEALYQRAYACIDLGKYDQAITDLDRVLEIDSGYYRAYWLRAFAYEHKGDRKRAISDNLAALRLNPKFGPAISDLGTAYLENKDYDRAITLFDRAISNSPQSSDDYNSRGLCYRNKGDFDRAIADYTKAIELDPWYATAYCNRGIVWQNKHDYRKAFADFSRALELDADFVNAANSLSWLLATCPQPNLRDGAMAVKYAEQACRSSYWRDGACMDTLAAACAENGEFEKAVWWQEKCLQDSSLPKGEIAGAKQRLDLYRKRQTFTEK